MDKQLYNALEQEWKVSNHPKYYKYFKSSKCVLRIFLQVFL